MPGQCLLSMIIEGVQKQNNAKTNEWRMKIGELSSNINLGRVTSLLLVVSLNSHGLTVEDLHEELCHPGVSRLLCFLDQEISPSLLKLKKYERRAELKPLFW